MLIYGGICWVENFKQSEAQLLRMFTVTRLLF